MLVTLVVIGIAILLVLESGILVPRPPVVYGTPLYYSQFIGVAELSQSRTPGGPWTPVAVLGLGVGSSTSGSSAARTLEGSGCAPRWSNASSPIVPATPSDAHVGAVSAWFLISSDAYGDLLLTVVTYTSDAPEGAALAIVPGTCASAYAGGGAVPTSVVDSPVVVNRTNHAGGTSFLQNNSVASEELEIQGPYWIVTYSTCPFFATRGHGSEFVATYGAVNGVYVDATSQSVTC